MTAGTITIGAIGIHPTRAKMAGIDHLPDKLADVMALSPAYKTLLAGCVASGCDAVAYYRPDEAGTLQLSEHIDLYPARATEFSATTIYNPATHDTPEHERENRIYHIPVTDKAGNLAGVVALHAPESGYSRNRTAEEETLPGDLHEPCHCRQAKLAMASHIIAHESRTLLPGWQSQTLKPDTSLEAKRRYFHMLKEDFINALGDGSKQALHVTGVADLMTLAAEKAINAPGREIIGEPQRSLLHDIAVLHDVGKLQAATPFLTSPWRDGDREQENETRNHYFMGQNHNHPLFTLLTLSAYPDEAMTAAAHHHGLLRYSDAELEKGMGDHYKNYKLLSDNVPFDRLSPLSRFLRICDVTEAICGSYAQKPLAFALGELAKRAGYDEASHSFHSVEGNCNSIDPDYLCMLIDSGMFQQYGRMRTAQPGGWKDKNGAERYDEAAVDKICAEVLAACQWQDKKAAVEQKLRAAVEADPFVKKNSPARSI